MKDKDMKKRAREEKIREKTTRSATQTATQTNRRTGAIATPPSRSEGRRRLKHRAPAEARVT